MKLSTAALLFVTLLTLASCQAFSTGDRFNTVADWNATEIDRLITELSEAKEAIRESTGVNEVGTQLLILEHDRIGKAIGVVEQARLGLIGSDDADALEQVLDETLRLHIDIAGLEKMIAVARACSGPAQ